MMKVIAMLVALVVGIVILSFGLALGMLGIWYLVEGFAFWIAHVEFVRMFVSLALGTWMLVIANAIMWTFGKVSEPIQRMFDEEN